MKKMIIAAMLLGLWTTAKADGVTTVKIGTLTDGTEVNAECMNFEKRIFTTKFSPNNDYMLIGFREMNKKGTYWKNKGTLAYYSMAEKKIMWEVPFNYNNQMTCTSYGILTYGNGTIQMLDKQDGQPYWKADGYPVKIDNELKVVLAYGYQGGTKVYAYGLEYGEERWTTKVTHDTSWGWNDALQTDSTHFIVIGDDVNRIDLNTGERQSYKAKTGVTDVGAALLSGLVALGGAVAASAISSYYYMPGYIGQNVITELRSNIWQKDSLYYFADREHVVCLDSTMTARWSYDLPSKTAARSFLVSQDSTLYMLSMGYGLRSSGVPKKMGRPFIAAWNMNTGENRFMNLLTVKKDMMSDAFITPECAYMLFDKGLAYKRNLNDSTVEITPWDVEKYGKLYSLVKNEIYTSHEMNSMFMPISFDGANCPVMTSKGDVHVVNEHLDIRTTYPAASIYYPMARWNDHVFIYHSYPQSELWMIQQEGFPEMKITTTVRSLGVMDHTMIIQGDYQLMFVDID